MSVSANKPDFLLIGAQKCGTTWLWNALSLHPGTDLRVAKDIHFFSQSEKYAYGKAWYLARFQNLSRDKLIGDASADYFHDYVLKNNTVRDLSLPMVPELVNEVLPGVRCILILRDPVSRAISAYYHHMRRRRLSPKVGLVDADDKNPHLRIIERGHYARFMRAWMSYLQEGRMLVLFFEEMIKQHASTLELVGEFLGLDSYDYPEHTTQPRNSRWNWSAIRFNYWTKGVFYRFFRAMYKTRTASILDRVFPSVPPQIEIDDVRYLRFCYLQEKDELEDLLGRRIQSWDYGSSLLRSSEDRTLDEV